jgi:hypothetical protein
MERSERVISSSGTSLRVLLVDDEVWMDFIAYFGSDSVETYGGASLLLAITLVQLTLLG